MDSYNPAMKDDKTLTQQDIDDAAVRLKPVLGIPPRKYLVAIYGAALLAAAFMLLLYPGLRRPGVIYSITADPPGSAIYVDGAYRGFAPSDVFLAAGSRAVRVSRPGFEAYEGAIEPKARFFGTLFVKPRADLDVTLSRVPGYPLLGDGMRAYASWALSGSHSESYQIPMVLSDAARAASIDPSGIDAYGFAGAAASYAIHAQSLRDAARASAVAYGRSAALTPVSLGRLVSALASEIRAAPAMLAALAADSGEAVRGVRPRTAVIFQDYGLLPWRTVEGNAGLALQLAGAGRVERRRRVRPVLDELGLSSFKRFYPSGLSGGMKQRVAIARALAAEPDLLLMDEPFSSLDALTREAAQEFLLSVRRSRPLTVIVVTHSIEEAVYLAESVFVMSGRNPGTVSKRFDIPENRADARSATGDFRAAPRYLKLCAAVRAALRGSGPTDDGGAA